MLKACADEANDGGSGTVLYSDYRLAEPKLYYIQTDHLGTPLEVTDTNGDLAWVGHYSAWGKLDKARDGNGNNAATDNPFRFQGQYHDEETELHYNRYCLPNERQGIQCCHSGIPIYAG